MPGMTIDPDDDVIFTPYGILFVAQRRQIYRNLTPSELASGITSPFTYVPIAGGRRARFEIAGSLNQSTLDLLCSSNYQYNILYYFGGLIGKFYGGTTSDLNTQWNDKFSLIVFEGASSWNNGTLYNSVVFNGGGNNGTINNSQIAYNSVVFNDATNTETGTVYGRATFRNNSDNYGTLSKYSPPSSCSFLFRTGSRNYGTITGNASFYNVRNYGTINGDGLFSGNQAINNGIIQGHAVFINSAHNQGGTVEGPLRFRNTTNFSSTTRFGTHSAVYFGPDDTAIAGTDASITIANQQYFHIQGDHILDTKTAGDWLIANGTTNITQYTSNNNRNGQWGYNKAWFASQLLAQQEKTATEYAIERGLTIGYYAGDGARNSKFVFNLTWYNTYSEALIASENYYANVWLSEHSAILPATPAQYTGPGTYGYQCGYKNVWYPNCNDAYQIYNNDLTTAFRAAAGTNLVQYTVEPFFEGMTGNRFEQWAYNNTWYANNTTGLTTALTLIAQTWLTNNGMNLTQYWLEERYRAAGNANSYMWVQNGMWGWNNNWYDTQTSAQFAKDVYDTLAWASDNGLNITQYTGPGVYNGQWGYNGVIYATQEIAQTVRDEHISAATTYLSSAGGTIFQWSSDGLYKNKWGYYHTWYNSQADAQAAKDADNATASAWLSSNGTNITQYTGAGDRNGKWGYNNTWYDNGSQAQNQKNTDDAAAWLISNGMNIAQYTGAGIAYNGKWGYNNTWYNTQEQAQLAETSLANAAAQTAWLISNGMNIAQYTGAGTQQYKWGYNNLWYYTQQQAQDKKNNDDLTAFNWGYHLGANVTQYTGAGTYYNKWTYNRVFYNSQADAQAAKDADNATASAWLSSNGMNITQYTAESFYKYKWGYNNTWYITIEDAQAAAQAGN